MFSLEARWIGLIAIVALCLCRAAPALAEASANGQGFVGTVVQTMDAAGYTYVEVDVGERTIWAAGPRTQLAVGDEVVVPAGMLMRDFGSKTLGRTFAEIYFVSALRPPREKPGASVVVEPADSPEAAPLRAHERVRPAPKVAEVLDGLSGTGERVAIGDLLASPAAFAGKRISVRGKVVKFTAAVLGKNWLHIDDGSGEKKDLTVTTSADAAVGDVVVATGVPSLDRDFGAGYRYDVIIEDAAVTVE